MKTIKILSALLALILAFGAFTFPALADDPVETTAPGETGEAETGETETDPEEDPGEEPEIDPSKLNSDGFAEDVATELNDNYIKTPFKTVEAKLNTMKRYLENDRYSLYAEPWTGEVYCYDKKSGQVLSTNPYDVYTTGTTDEKKKELMSQIIIKYSDLTGAVKTYTSYEQAAMNEQIQIKNIKGGIRVEYTIGRSESSYLVPRQISMARMEEMIFSKLPGWDEYIEAGRTEEAEKNLPFLSKQVIYKYIAYDPNNTSLPERVIVDMQTKFPVTKKKKLAIYVLDSSVTQRELGKIEAAIKEYSPEYTYDDMEKDHLETEYNGTSVEPALFKLALEYSLTDTGMKVSLPANGIRYDETNYKLEEFQLLPYIGAGSNEYTGYNFLPDGSGALTRFEDYVGKSVNISGSMYGTDYAYITIEGSRSETMRFPVFGIVENTEKTEQRKETVLVPQIDPETGEETQVEQVRFVKETYSQPKGFLAIIEEGDALVSIMSTSGSTTHKFYSVITKFTPRPKDQYKLSSSISVGSSSAITVVSERKYVGNLTMNFVMLTAPSIAEEKNIDKYYETSWVGMAKAYRDYLEQSGSLKPLASSDVADQMPLYIETFGSISTTKRILSMPIEVDVALTSFEDVKKMYDELAAAGVSNINFKLTGYANGDMYGQTIPSTVKWAKSVGGEDGFKDLVAYAKEKGFGIYPDFDFTSVSSLKTGDGFRLKKHATKTINDQYVYKVVYNGVSGAYDTVGLLVSPSAYSYFFDKFEPKYSKFDLGAISVASLGNDLNSDFDTDEPYNREDSRELVTQFFEKIEEKYPSVMTEGGNAYTLRYLDHLLGVSLQSSRYALTSTSVPFAGVVLHGYLNFAGTPINMEGDIDYAILKAIENGSALYFILSYDNTELLKESVSLSKYFSVRYDIWRDELIRQYNKLNDAIGSLQTTPITGHAFLKGERIPDADEVEADLKAAEEAVNELYDTQLRNAYIAMIRQMREQYLAGSIPAGLEIKPEVPEKPEVKVTVGGLQEDGSYTETKYTTEDGTVVKVTYGDKVSFLINYNNFAIKTWDETGKEYTVDKYSFVKIG